MPELSAGTGLAPLLSYAFAVFGVLALLGLVLWFVRRSGGAAPARKSPPARRLAVVDQIALDDKRRLVLVQRDGVQHLVILGGANELLVESGIVESRATRRDWDVASLEGERATDRDLPAFPAGPHREGRESAVREPVAMRPMQRGEARSPERDMIARDMPARDAARAAPQRVSPPAPEPFLADLPPLPGEGRVPVEPRLAPLESEELVPREPSLGMPSPTAGAATEDTPSIGVARREAAGAPRRPEPALPLSRPDPDLSTTSDTPSRPAEGRRAPGSNQGSNPAGAGLLARLTGKRPPAAAPDKSSAPPPARPAETAQDEPRIAFSEALPEMPDHAAPESAFERPNGPTVEPAPSIEIDPARDMPPPSVERPAPAVQAEHREPEAGLAATSAASREPEAGAPDIVIPPLERPTPEPSAPVGTGARKPPESAPRVEPDMARLFEMIAPDSVSPPIETEPLAAPRAAAPARPSPEPPPAAAADAPEAPRAAVKIDPYFASMAQRLEETLRRPLNQTAGPAGPPTASAPKPAVDPDKEQGGAPAAAQPPGLKPDELEMEMASLLGRAPPR